VLVVVAVGVGVVVAASFVNMMHARAREPEQKTVAPSSSMPIAPREENDAERGQPLSSSSSAHLSMPAKLLLLSQLLGRDGVITNNGR
jgi:hypothetical protein